MTPPTYCLTAIRLFSAPIIFYVTSIDHILTPPYFPFILLTTTHCHEIAFAVKTFIFDVIFLSFTTFLLFGHFAPEMVLKRAACVKYFSPSRKYLTQAALSNEM